MEAAPLLLESSGLASDVVRVIVTILDHEVGCTDEALDLCLNNLEEGERDVRIVMLENNKSILITKLDYLLKLNLSSFMHFM